MLEEMDVAVSTAMNAYSQTNAVFDETMVVIAHNHLLKGGVLLALLWWTWMRRGNGLLTRDLFFIRTVVGARAAVAVARALQNLLPHRTRPFLDGTLDFVPPVGLDPTALDGWSSFPSDHAVLFFA
ncbi:MAG TPA: hypothetical protein VK943_17660, partial [Arenibaculum sp.]|nr:hypothetical protein [Arenibaculum sp.]